MTIEISVIIPVLDQWTLTEACLRSLAAHSPDTIEVIVVDNASTDETPQACPPLGQTLFPERFHYLRQETNRNFGPAGNIGARHARGNRLFFLNNDTEVQKNWLPPLQHTLTNPRIGAVGPRLLYPEGRVQHVGIACAPQGKPLHLFEYFPGEHPAALRKRRCQALTAAALLLDTALFHQLDGFFEGFRNGCEDLDLCARIRATDLQLAVNPESVIIHHTSQSAGRFDHDDANAALLHARQPNAFVPDLHLFARQEGYLLQLNAWLVPYMTPTRRPDEPEPREAGAVTRLLNQEPLWEHGYALLAAHAAASGDLDLALATLFHACQFFPSLTNYHKLHDLAARTGRVVLADDVAQKIGRVREILHAPHELHRKALALAAHFRALGQQDLSRIYARWADRPFSDAPA